MLNIYPYNNGHLMIAPLRHVKDLSSLNDAELLDLMRSVEKARSLLSKALKPDGFNIGVNMSRVAGAGIPGHLHVHIVPRWNGDTNFMPVIGNTKVISQSLDALHKLLRHAYAKTDTRARK
jgi:ATP adenylyltransferase